MTDEVAPYVGAWIETKILFQTKEHKRSHPMWVRGLKPYPDKGTSERLVAPYVGAWIETDFIEISNRHTESHPMWVRGLKPYKGKSCLTS